MDGPASSGPMPTESECVVNGPDRWLARESSEMLLASKSSLLQYHHHHHDITITIRLGSADFSSLSPVSFKMPSVQQNTEMQLAFPAEDIPKECFAALSDEYEVRPASR